MEDKLKKFKEQVRQEENKRWKEAWELMPLAMKLIFIYGCLNLVVLSYYIGRAI